MVANLTEGLLKYISLVVFKTNNKTSLIQDWYEHQSEFIQKILQNYMPFDKGNNFFVCNNHLFSIQPIEKYEEFLEYTTQPYKDENSTLIVPTLYVYNVKNNKFDFLFSSSHLFNSKFNKFWWLAEMTLSCSNVDVFKEFESLLLNYFDENIQILNSLSPFIKKSEFRYLGAGVNGIAFAIDKDKVLKIHKNPIEHQKTNESISRIWNKSIYADTELMVYDTGEFVGASDRGFNIFWSIMQRVKTNNIEFNNELEELLSFCKAKAFKYLTNDFKEELLATKNKKIRTKLLNKLYLDIMQACKQQRPDTIKLITEEYPALKANWLRHFIREILIKIVTGRVDLHLGNIGLNNQGYFVFFDPSNEEAYFDIDASFSIKNILINKYS